MNQHSVLSETQLKRHHQQDNQLITQWSTLSAQF